MDEFGPFEHAVIHAIRALPRLRAGLAERSAGKNAGFSCLVWVLKRPRFAQRSELIRIDFSKKSTFSLQKMFMLPHRMGQMLDLDQVFAPLSARQQLCGASLDVAENETQFTVRLDLPGFKQEELDIEVTDENVVHVHAKREAEKGGEGEKYLVQERTSTEVSRTFTLPKDVQHTAVTASLENGVLQLVVPKAEKQVPQRAKVQFK